MNISLSQHPGIVSVRRNHLLRYSIGERVNYLLYHKEEFGTFAISERGYVYLNNTFLGLGFDPSGTLINLPTDNGLLNFVHIAGGSQMMKWANNRFLNWGLSAPLGQLSATLVNVTDFALQNCDDASQWTFVDCSGSDEATVKTEGAGSIKIDITAPAAPVITTRVVNNTVLNAPGSIAIDINVDNANAITHFAVVVLLDINGVEILRDQDIVISTTGDFSTYIAFGGDQTLPAQSFIKSISFALTTTTTQSIYIDNIVVGTTGREDSLGAKYKYAYRNSVTGKQSNMNATASALVLGNGNTAVISGFVPPGPLDDADLYVIFRDTGGDGIFKEVGTLSTVEAFFNDNQTVQQLGDVDLGDHATPPSATVAVQFLNSVWLNDLNASRRIWRSVPTRYGDFTDFFEVSVTGDEVVGFTVIRGILFVLTRQHIAQTINADSEAPLFFNIANVGPVNSHGFYTARDFCVVVAFSGVYVFDGANLHRIEQVSNLFNPESNNARRINETNVNSVVVGSDNIRIWISYTMLNGHWATLVYHLESQTIVEESTILTVHESSDQLYGHTAGDLEGNIYSVYEGSTYPAARLKTSIVEFDEHSLLQELHLQAQSDEAIDVNVFRAGFSSASESHAIAAGNRANYYFPIDETKFEKNLYVDIESPGGEMQIWDVGIVHSMTNQRTHYDSGIVFLSPEKVAVQRFRYVLWGLSSGTVTVKLLIDNINVAEYSEAVSENLLINMERILNPRSGYTARLIISGTRVQILSTNLYLLPFGTNEITKVEMVR